MIDCPCPSFWGLPVYLLCFDVRFCVLLGPCICFVSLLYLGLNVLGDNALIR